MSTVLEALQKGDRAAISDVYKENRKVFLAFAQKFGLSTEDAKDVYQEAFISFLHNVSSGKLTKLHSTISTYLISIGKNKIYEKLRENNHTISDETLLNLNLENNQQLNNLDVEKKTLNENELLLKKHFKNLGKKCQELLTLFYYNSLTISEIKTVKGYNSENVVKSAKSRCLKQLRESIKTD